MRLRARLSGSGGVRFRGSRSQSTRSSRATAGRPGIHSGTSPASAPEWIPDLRFATSGMTRAYLPNSSVSGNGVAADFRPAARATRTGRSQGNGSAEPAGRARRLAMAGCGLPRSREAERAAGPDDRLPVGWRGARPAIVDRRACSGNAAAILAQPDIGHGIRDRGRADALSRAAGHQRPGAGRACRLRASRQSRQRSDHQCEGSAEDAPGSPIGRMATAVHPSLPFPRSQREAGAPVPASPDDLGRITRPPAPSRSAAARLAPHAAPDRGRQRAPDPHAGPARRCRPASPRRYGRHGGSWRGDGR